MSIFVARIDPGADLHHPTGNTKMTKHEERLFTEKEAQWIQEEICKGFGLPLSILHNSEVLKLTPEQMKANSAALNFKTSKIAKKIREK